MTFTHLVHEGVEVLLTTSEAVEGRFVRPEETGLYVNDGKRLVRKSDGYVLCELIADPDWEC